MTQAIDIDEIDNIVDMVKTMASLGVSPKGLRTLDGMKDRVKCTLASSENKPNCSAKEAFSLLIEAKQKNDRKRATLHQFYEDTEVCLKIMDDNVRSLLKQNIGDLKDKLAMNKKNLIQKDYIVLVAGETNSGKSTLLNLILGEKLLPSSILSKTSTIWELKYGATPKLVAHFKDNDPESEDTTKTLRLGGEQSYLHEITSFVRAKTNRGKSSDYKKIELFLPHSLLKQRIVLVDTPGICESNVTVEDMVKEYLLDASAFIYVLNSANVSGTQNDKVKKFIEHARRVSLNQQRESSSTRALFVCNKWDQVPPDECYEVQNHFIEKLRQCWPGLKPDSQIIFLSSTNALIAQRLGVINEEFAGLICGMSSMVLKSIEEQLQTQWRWLDYLLSRMVYQTKAFFRNSHKERPQIFERMMLITERINKIEKQQSLVNKEMQEYLECKTANAVSALSDYLKSAEVVKQFTSWTLDDVPNAMESWEVTKHYIQKAYSDRLQQVIAAWEEEHHVFADVRTSMIQYFQQRFNFLKGQLQNLESSVLGEDAASPSTGPQVPDSFSVAEKVIIGVTSPIWVPVGLVVLIASAPVVGAMAVRGKVKDLRKPSEFEKDKSTFMAKESKTYLFKMAEEQNLREHVLTQLKESQDCLKQVLARNAELIQASKMLCQQLKDEKRSQKEIEVFYKPLYQKSLQLREHMALFGIKEVRTMDISCSDLEWNDDASSLLGTGSFASVYRGTLKQREGKQAVALKVWNDELKASNASAFIAETETLRKLNHPLVVKFYGSSLLNKGDQIRALIVMELCKENLRTHIFQNPKNIPGIPSSTPPTDRNTIRWSKDIADALEFIHRQGLVHRDLKLDNILISYEGAVKIADVGVTKEAKMITGTFTGTPAYNAPEVIKSSVYDSKADMYSFGIMMWEMWYGRRAFHDVQGDLNTLLDEVVVGVRPSHVDGSRKPSDGWMHLMQWCWDGEANRRPTAELCHEKLTKMYQEAITPM